MGSLLSRSVELEISNRTQNIALKEPRTYFNCGRCSMHPRAELSPGSSDTCRFSGSFPFWGVAGILVYEADSFTLAIHFSNPIDYNKFSVELGLELSPGKAHLDDLEATYRRMAKGIYSSSFQDIKFARVTVAGSHETARLSHGRVKVTATMSYDTDSRIKVVLEEEEGSGEEAEGWRPRDVRVDGCKGIEKEVGERETEQLLLQEAKDSPGSAWTA